MDKKQIIRYSKDELEIIKKFVNSREDSVLILRNHFLQLELTEEEKTFLKSMPVDFLKTLKKSILPSLEREVPLLQEATMQSRLTELDKINPITGLVQIQANDIIIEYTEQQFRALTENVEPTIILSELSQPLSIDQNEQRVINMIAYNNIIGLTEARLQNLIYLSSIKEESQEEKEKREKADSTK